MRMLATKARPPSSGTERASRPVGGRVVGCRTGRPSGWCTGWPTGCTAPLGSSHRLTVSSAHRLGDSSLRRFTHPLTPTAPLIAPSPPALHPPHRLIVQFVLYVIYLGFFAEFKTSMRLKDEVRLAYG